MVIGACTVHLRLTSSRSLKDRRRVVRSLKQRLRNKFNVSVAEIDPDDSWDGATLGIALAAQGRGEADRLLRKVLDHIEWLRPGIVHDYLIEIL